MTTLFVLAAVAGLFAVFFGYTTWRRLLTFSVVIGLIVFAATKPVEAASTVKTTADGIGVLAYGFASFISNVG
jgi:type IV secretory pathway VirB2 component (pilin)